LLEDSANEISLLVASRAAELQSLTSQLTGAQSTIAELNASNASLQSLVTDYENALTLLLEKLRPYAYNQTQAMLALHKHYQAQLDNERSTSMQLRLEHAEWQAGLGRVAEYARLALKMQSEVEIPYKRQLKELKEENRVLRRLAGWEERKKGDSSDDEEDEQHKEKKPE
jgi:cell division protein FtsB